MRAYARVLVFRFSSILVLFSREVTYLCKAVLCFQTGDDRFYRCNAHGTDGDEISVSVTTILPASINTPLFDKALTRLGVKPRPVAPVYEPELVADAILYAAEHPQRQIYVGSPGKILELFQRIAPVWLTWF